MLLNGATSIPARTEQERKEQAAQALEANLVKTLLQSSGAFKPSQAAGGTWASDLFIDALADAVTKGTPLGIGKSIIDSTQAPGSKGAAGPVPGPTSLPRQAITSQRPTPGMEMGHVNDGAITALAGGEGRLTSNFGERHDPFTGETKNHRGVDVAAAEGTPIVSAMPGRVVFAGERGGYGNTVEIDHGNGVHTLYAHASELHAKEGDVVQAGTPVAEVGSTGRSTGNHLHFELRVNGQAVDPRKALKAYSHRVEEAYQQVSQSGCGHEGK